MVKDDKIMFELYYDPVYNQEYKVVYYTELNEHNKESEINKALAGEHIYSGYISNLSKEQSKEQIELLIQQLNGGNVLSEAEIDVQLRGCLV